MSGQYQARRPPDPGADRAEWADWSIWLCKNWAGRVWLLAASLAIPESGRDDVVQETLLKCLRSCQKGLKDEYEEKKFESFVMKIAVNTARDWMRKERKHRRQTDGQPIEELSVADLATEGANSVEDDDQRRQLDPVVDAVKRLFEPRLKAFIQSYVYPTKTRLNPRDIMLYCQSPIMGNFYLVDLIEEIKAGQIQATYAGPAEFGPFVEELAADLFVRFERKTKEKLVIKRVLCDLCAFCHAEFRRCVRLVLARGDL